MKRLDFLAIIPSLSAIPFIGKEIIQKSDRIEIFQPEQMKDEIKSLYSEECEIHIVKNGRVLAQGFVTSVNATRPQFDTTCRDNGGAKTFTFGSWEVEVIGTLNGPITAEAMSYISEGASRSTHLMNKLIV